jgi:hypothetical protein
MACISSNLFYLLYSCKSDMFIYNHVEKILFLQIQILFISCINKNKRNDRKRTFKHIHLR